MDILSYLIDSYTILIPFLYAIGTGIKRTNKISNDYITLVITVIGAIFGVLMGGFTVEAIIQGSLIGFATTGMYEAKKNI